MKNTLLALIILAFFLIAGYVLSESSDTGTVSVTINTITTIDVNNSPMAFALDPGTPDENGTADEPFVLINTGSTDIDIAVCASPLIWSGTSGGTDLNYYRYIADNNEASSCLSIETDKWIDMNYTGSGHPKGPLCETFQQTDASDQLNVGIKIMAPIDEPDSSTPNSTVTFYIADDTTGANDAQSGNC